MKSSKVLAFVLAIFAIGSIYRALHFYLTGFFVPDEFAYIYYHLGDFPYQGRYFFNWANFILFKIFQVSSPDRVVLFMPFYFMFWLSIGLVSAYKTMKLFDIQEKVVNATLLLSLSIPVFLLFTITILSEPVAFATSMLGIYFVARYWKKRGFLLPFLAALCFVAADYTRFDFIVFQVLGIVPFVLADFRSDLSKSLTSFSLFALPATIFLIIPNNTAIGTIQSLQSVIDATHQLPAVTTITSSTLTTITTGPPPTGNLAFNIARFLALGLGVGFNPIVALILAVSFFLAIWGVAKKRKYSIPTFWMGLVSLGALGGILIQYSVIPNLPASTAIRYSYDALPAFFVMVPLLLSRFKSRKPYALIIAGLVITTGVGAVSLQSSLQTNLTFSYPFLNGHQSFLGLDYRTPYAQMRDYFLSLPPQHFIVMAEDPASLDSNVTNDWRFTPGVSSISIAFVPYNYSNFHHGNFYAYIPNYEKPRINSTVVWLVYSNSASTLEEIAS